MRGVVQIETSQPAADASGDCRQAFPPYVWAGLAAILALTVLAYGPVLFNFFVGDDFVHLTWLKDAIHQPEMVWRNFHSSWLDGTTTKFYRPLISVFMVTDYLAWGTNGLGFHLTNLAFHLAGSLFLFLITAEISRECSLGQTAKDQTGGQPDYAWALAAAGIFALYPLHPEAVSWITGRVDSIVTTFCLAQLWCYIRWRRTNRLGWLAASLISFALGLMSKEMAITVPAVIFAYEFFFNVPLPEKPKFSLSLVRPFFYTLPFWIVLAAYFVVRRIALGTFVGGYDDSLLFIADLKAFALGWVHALRMTVEPLNRQLIGSHNVLTKLWELSVVAAVAFGAWRFATGKGRRAFLFSLAWLGLALLPVYKIFAIADDLQGSRLAYLATVPLSVLLAYGLTFLPPRLTRASAAVASAFLLLCATVLWINNQAWRSAGLESTAIRAALSSFYAETPGDPQTLILGLPDQVHGAYVSRNALWGMTKVPQLQRDISNCLSINAFEPILPFGLLKNSIAANPQSILVLRWDSRKKTLEKVDIPPGGSATPTAVLPSRYLTPVSGSFKRPEVELNLGSDYSCWLTEFVRLKLRVTTPGQPAGADLLYANSISPEFRLGNRAHCDLAAGNGEKSLLFALHALPEWCFGGAPRLKLLLPPGCVATVEEVDFVRPDAVMPAISFNNCGYLGSKGYLHLGHDKPQQEVLVDSSHVTGAASTEVEVTRANLLFEEQNCALPSKYAGKHVIAPLTGKVLLDLNEFPAPGIYELRAWAKDKSGKTLGVASDHVVIAVDP